VSVLVTGTCSHCPEAVNSWLPLPWLEDTATACVDTDRIFYKLLGKTIEQKTESDTQCTSCIYTDFFSSDL